MPTNDDIIVKECARRLREWFFSDDPRVTGAHRWFAPELERVLDYADKKLTEADDAGMRARDSALEEAAKVAEVYISIMEKMGMDDAAFGGLVASGTISEQIRALKEKPNAKG